MRAASKKLSAILRGSYIITLFSELLELLAEVRKLRAKVLDSTKGFLLLLAGEFLVGKLVVVVDFAGERGDRGAELALDCRCAGAGGVG